MSQAGMIRGVHDLAVAGEFRRLRLQPVGAEETRRVVANPLAIAAQPPIAAKQLVLQTDHVLVPAPDAHRREDRARKDGAGVLNPAINLLVIAAPVVVVLGIAVGGVISEEVRHPIAVLVAKLLPSGFEGLIGASQQDLQQREFIGPLGVGVKRAERAFASVAGHVLGRVGVVVRAVAGHFRTDRTVGEGEAAFGGTVLGQKRGEGRADADLVEVGPQHRHRSLRSPRHLGILQFKPDQPGDAPPRSLTGGQRWRLGHFAPRNLRLRLNPIQRLALRRLRCRDDAKPFGALREVAPRLLLFLAPIRFGARSWHECDGRLYGVEEYLLCPLTHSAHEPATTEIKGPLRRG